MVLIRLCSRTGFVHFLLTPSTEPHYSFFFFFFFLTRSQSVSFCFFALFLTQRCLLSDLSSKCLHHFVQVRNSSSAVCVRVCTRLVYCVIGQVIFHSSVGTFPSTSSCAGKPSTSGNERVRRHTGTHALKVKHSRPNKCCR